MITFDETYRIEALYLFDRKHSLEIKHPGGVWEALPIGDKLDLYKKLTTDDAVRLGNGVELSDGRMVRFCLV